MSGTRAPHAPARARETSLSAVLADDQTLAQRDAETQRIIAFHREWLRVEMRCELAAYTVSDAFRRVAHGLSIAVPMSQQEATELLQTTLVECRGFQGFGDE